MRISDWSSDVCSSDLHVGGQRQAVQRRRGGHAQLVFLDPTATGDRWQRVANDLAVANHLAALGNIFQGDLVALRYKVHGDQAIREQIGRASCRERVVPYV